MPILEGRQGIGKSSAVAALFGREYFGDHLPDTGSKDAADYVRGKWCIEVAELDSVRRSAVESAKAFFSRQVERFRPAYGRNEIEYPRRNVFVGTTNSDNYLRDNTGNRRFWPIAVEGHTDVEAILRDRNQLWAEAYARYMADEQWWLKSDGSTPSRGSPSLSFDEASIMGQEIGPWRDTVHNRPNTALR